MQAAGDPIEPMLKFLENLMLNPSYQSRKELYGFLEKYQMPITPDGRFYAYKWVREDFRDAHSGTFDNTPGKIVSMPRSEVDDNRDRTCSSGLHVCSRGYSRFSQLLLLVAVNPKDVVSIPSDYQDSKMRVCEYEVITQVPTNDYINNFEDQSVLDDEDEEEFNDEDEVDMTDEEKEAAAKLVKGLRGFLKKLIS